MITRNKLRKTMGFGGLYNRQPAYDPQAFDGLSYYNDKVTLIRNDLGEFDYGNIAG